MNCFLSVGDCSWPQSWRSRQGLKLYWHILYPQPGAGLPPPSGGFPTQIFYGTNRLPVVHINKQVLLNQSIFPLIVNTGVFAFILYPSLTLYLCEYPLDKYIQMFYPPHTPRYPDLLTLYHHKGLLSPSPQSFSYPDYLISLSDNVS